MSILYLLLSICLLVIGIQFLRGKWLEKLLKKSASPAQTRHQAVVIAPGLIGLGLGFFCFGFFKAKVWLTTGSVVFLLSVAYIALVLIFKFIKGSQKTDKS